MFADPRLIYDCSPDFQARSATANLCTGYLKTIGLVGIVVILRCNTSVINPRCRYNQGLLFNTDLFLEQRNFISDPKARHDGSGQGCVQEIEAFIKSDDASPDEGKFKIKDLLASDALMPLHSLNEPKT